MNNWFVSDLHLGHENLILKGYRRNFFSSVKDHDKTILDNLFSTVSKGDNLYLLGDIFWKYSSEQVKEVMKIFKDHRINIHWILGNHDKLSWTKYGVVKWVGQIKDISIEGQKINLCHYPMLVANGTHYNSIKLYGHIHHGDGTWKKMQNDKNINKYLNRSVNVNVELHDFKPWSFAEIIERIKDNNNWDFVKKQ